MPTSCVEGSWCWHHLLGLGFESCTCSCGYPSSCVLGLADIRISVTTVTAMAVPATAAVAKYHVGLLFHQDLVSWWEAAHYTGLQRRCAEAGMHDLAAKQATSLLRYIGAIPADKAFYEAGSAIPHSAMSSFESSSSTGLSAECPPVCLHFCLSTHLACL